MSDLKFRSKQSLGTKNPEDINPNQEISKIEPESSRVNTIHSEEPEKSVPASDPDPVFETHFKKKLTRRSKVLIATAGLLMFGLLAFFLSQLLLTNEIKPKSFYTPPKKNQLIYSTSRWSDESRHLAEGGKAMEFTFIVSDEDINSKQLIVIPGRLEESKLRNLRERMAQETTTEGSFDSVPLFVTGVDMNSGTIESLFHSKGTDKLLIPQAISAIKTLLINGRWVEHASSGGTQTIKEEHGMYEYTTTYSVEETEDYQIFTSIYEDPKINRRRLGSNKVFAEPDSLFIKKVSYINKGTGLVDKTDIVGKAFFEIVKLYDEGGPNSNPLNLDFSYGTGYSNETPLTDDDIKSIVEALKESFEFVEIDVEAFDLGESGVVSETVPDFSENGDIQVPDNFNQDNTDNLPVPSGNGRRLIASSSAQYKLFRVFKSDISFYFKSQQSGDNIIASSGIAIESVGDFPFDSANFGSEALKTVRQIITLKNIAESKIAEITNKVASILSYLKSSERAFNLKYKMIYDYLAKLKNVVDVGFRNLKPALDGLAKSIENFIERYTAGLNPDIAEQAYILNQIRNKTYDFTELLKANNLYDLEGIFNKTLLNPIDAVLSEFAAIEKDILTFKNSFDKVFYDGDKATTDLATLIWNSAKNLDTLPRSDSVASKSDLYDFSFYRSQQDLIFDYHMKIRNNTMGANETTMISAINELYYNIFVPAIWNQKFRDAMSSIYQLEGNYSIKLGYTYAFEKIYYKYEKYLGRGLIANVMQRLGDKEPVWFLYRSYRFDPAYNLRNALEVLTSSYNRLQGALDPKSRRDLIDLFKKKFKYEKTFPISTPIGIIQFVLRFEFNLLLKLTPKLNLNQISFILTPSAELGVYAGAEYTVILGSIGVGASLVASASFPFEFGFLFANSKFFIHGYLLLSVGGQAGVYYRIIECEISTIRVCVGRSWWKICFKIPTAKCSLGRFRFIDFLTVKYTIFQKIYDLIPYKIL